MITLFLCGDVMIGRGIDQVLPRSVDPRLFEPYVDSARVYVDLAERVNGRIPRSVPADYVWGAALAAMDGAAPDVRIVNLETAITTSDAAWPRKEVLYRTHPENVAVLRAARIDGCALANNHVLDWGQAGLLDTLDSLREGGLAAIGAARDRAAAQAPMIVPVPDGRVITVAFGSTTAGVPLDWAAAHDRPGVEVIDGWSPAIADALAARLEPIRRKGDVVVASVHWGSNWGYRIPEEQRRLAHRLVDVAGVDVVHGHSSHHPRAIEIYRGRLILYGCGDFITDYEGIAGHDEFRADLVLAYFPTVDAASGAFARMRIIPFRLRRFALVRAAPADAAWIRDAIDRHSQPLGARVDPAPDGAFEVNAR